MNTSSDVSTREVKTFEFKSAGKLPEPSETRLWNEPEPTQASATVLATADNVNAPIDVEVLVLTAREEGKREGENAARVVFEAKLQTVRTGIAIALQNFEDERHRYRRDVEAEVVRLALSIARRVLRREAQIDKQLLTSLVRAALDELEESTRVELRVHPSVVEDWQAFYSSGSLGVVEPTIVADPSIRPDACRVSTSAGTTELSIESGLGEIERGFFDMLERRALSVPALPVQ